MRDRLRRRISNDRPAALAGIVSTAFLRTAGRCGLHGRAERLELASALDDVGDYSVGHGRNRDLRFQPFGIGWAGPTYRDAHFAGALAYEKDLLVK
jgi:hypothetical protein